MMDKAIFLDRDGVLIEDNGLFTDPKGMQILDSVPEVLQALQAAGFLLVVVTNQAIVARGMLTEQQVKGINKYLSDQIILRGGPEIDAFYFCPHHPNADQPDYRQNCECRKPNPGMLLRAAAEYDIELEKSFMIGDRISDIIAGKKAGCSSVLMQNGRNKYQPIESQADVNWDITPDFTCANLVDAREWILTRISEKFGGVNGNHLRTMR